MSKLGRLSTTFLLIGFQLVVFAMTGSVVGNAFRGEQSTIEALIISGFLVYLCVLIGKLYVYMGGERMGRTRGFILSALAAVAGILVFSGTVIYAVEIDRSPPVYPCTLFISGSVLAMIGGVIGAVNRGDTVTANISPEIPKT